jgi:LPXTG-motif cell wall-anchored protein
VALSAAPAAAHAGGRAQLYVESVHLEPQAGGWRAELVVRDADSGRPEPGFGVQLTAQAGDDRSPVEPLPLADPDGDGCYGAVVPLTAGSWSVTVKADELPGGPRALPFSRTWSATLQAGQPLDLGAPASAAAGRGSGGQGPALALAGLGVLGALALLIWRRRRRAWIREAALG